MQAGSSVYQNIHQCPLLNRKCYNIQIVCGLQNGKFSKWICAYFGWQLFHVTTLFPDRSNFGEFSMYLGMWGKVFFHSLLLVALINSDNNILWAQQQPVARKHFIWLTDRQSPHWSPLASTIPNQCVLTHARGKGKKLVRPWFLNSWFCPQAKLRLNALTVFNLIWAHRDS